MLSHGRAAAMMVAATFMWATAGVVTRHLDAARGFEVTFWRSFFTVVSLLFILPAWQGRVVFARMRGAGWHLWVSGLCWSVMFTAFMVALTLTTTANVLVTSALTPLFTALAARVCIGQRLPRRTWVTIVVAGAGIAWMYAGKIEQGEWLGTLVALCVPLAAACNWTVQQHGHAKGHDVDLVPAVLVGALISAGLTLPLAWPMDTSAHDLRLLAFLGLVQLAIPCVLAVLCTRVLTAPEVALLGLLEVVFGIALAWLGAGEVPAATTLSGGCVVIGALVFNGWLGWRSRHAAQAAAA